MAVRTRAALRRTGVDDAALRRAWRRGDLVRVGRDRFADAGPPPTAAERLAAVGSGIALTGLTAVRAHGFAVDDEEVEVAVRRGARGLVRDAAVTVHETRRWHAEVIDDVAVVPLSRAAVDVARTRPLRQSVPVLDAVLRAGTTRTQLERELIARSPGNVRARRAVELADHRAESPLESLLRLVLVEAGLPPADLQHVVRERGRVVARVDL